MSEEYPPVGHPLQKLAARLTELLDEDYWAECEVLLLEAWNTRPDSKPEQNCKSFCKLYAEEQKTIEFWKERCRVCQNESRENYALIWSRRCEYHGGRPGVVLHNGVWLCEECASMAAICAEV